MGRIVYRLATGYSRVTSEYPTQANPDLPAWIDSFVEGALARAAADRYRTAQDMLFRLPAEPRRAYLQWRRQQGESVWRDRLWWGWRSLASRVGDRLRGPQQRLLDFSERGEREGWLRFLAAQARERLQRFRERGQREGWRRFLTGGITDRMQQLWQRTKQVRWHRRAIAGARVRLEWLWERRQRISWRRLAVAGGAALLVAGLGVGARRLWQEVQYRSASTATPTGAPRTVPDLDLDLMPVDAGTFTMGSPAREKGRVANEEQHEVTLTKAFWLGKYEVTQAQYEGVMQTNPSPTKGAKLPVANVNWAEASAFGERLTERELAAGRLPEGYEYRLPTEAEWEYACRAGTRSAYSFGIDRTKRHSYGWHYLSDDDGAQEVGLKEPNAWGLHDMHGGVSEWCLDKFGAYPETPVTDPVGPSTGIPHLSRGGSRSIRSRQFRSAYREKRHPGSSLPYVGFRIALAPVVKQAGGPLARGPVPVIGETYAIPGHGLALTPIEPGAFMMGSPNGELGRAEDELQHQVTLTRAFWMGKYEVTQREYDEVVGDHYSGVKGARLPVTSVHHDDAVIFCEQLTAQERYEGRLPAGYEYRLPTEAEWEYACRAGPQTTYSFGNDESELEDYAWRDESNERPTIEVGQKKPNAWGLHDMHGNAKEWCLDWYAKGYRMDLLVDPPGPLTGTHRVVRGRHSSSYGYRAAKRAEATPKSPSRDLGFRVVLAPPVQRPPMAPFQADKGPVIGESFSVPGSGLELAPIAAGSFTMGSPATETGRGDDESQRTITLTKPFWLGKHEVTAEQHDRVRSYDFNHTGRASPMTGVSWGAAMDFCRELTEMEARAGRLPPGYEYRLPTDAEWEYACRAGTQTAYSFGDDPEKLTNFMWYGGHQGRGQERDGKKVPNAWDLYDMHGGVWEWCFDRDGEPVAGVVTDPSGPLTGKRRVRRGGRGSAPTGLTRSASRNRQFQESRDSSTGFRIALAPPVKLANLPPQSPAATAPRPTALRPLEEAQAPIPGAPFAIPLLGLEMMPIRTGSFVMGSPTTEKGHDDERQHQVTLTKEFWLGRYELTQREYEKLMGETPSKYQSSELPVERVSWNDAASFCQKLTRQERQASRLPTGYEYRLPTEAEWEYACRAGTEAIYSFGDDAGKLKDYAWYYGNAGGWTHEWGQRKSNSWGLYDMHGNVAEWCWDRFGSYPAGAATDPIGARTGSTRVYRGGSRRDGAVGCRAACRQKHEPSAAFDIIGFRVALAPAIAGR